MNYSRGRSFHPAANDLLKQEFLQLTDASFRDMLFFDYRGALQGRNQTSPREEGGKKSRSSEN